MDATRKRNILAAIDLAWRPHKVKWILSDEEEQEFIEIVEALVADLDYKEYREILDAHSAGRQKVLIQKARELALANKPPEVSKVKKPLTPKEKEEQERLEALRKEREFFFGKDKENAQCNCGAAYTSFPNYHKHFCALAWKTDYFKGTKK